MTQDQNGQTTNSNYNITEQIDEQVLQDIYGKGIGCCAVAIASSIEAGAAATKALQTKSPVEATKALMHGRLADSAIKTASINPPICPYCAPNVSGYLAVKAVGG
jgi:hypothetical protein